MFCKDCGKNLSDEAKFCNGCGAKIESAQAAVNTAPQPPTYTPPVQPVPPPRPAYTPPVQQPVPPPRPAYTPPVQQPVPPPRPAYTPSQTYAPPAPSAYAPQTTREPLRVMQYIGMFLLMSIPLAGFILLFVWSFGGSVNLNKKNFARAMLIISLIGVVLSMIFGTVLASVIGELIGNMSGNF